VVVAALFSQSRLDHRSQTVGRPPARPGRAGFIEAARARFPCRTADRRKNGAREVVSSTTGGEFLTLLTESVCRHPDPPRRRRCTCICGFAGGGFPGRYRGRRTRASWRWRLVAGGARAAPGRGIQGGDFHAAGPSWGLRAISSNEADSRPRGGGHGGQHEHLVRLGAAGHFFGPGARGVHKRGRAFVSADLLGAGASTKGAWSGPAPVPGLCSSQERPRRAGQVG